MTDLESYLKEARNNFINDGNCLPTFIDNKFSDDIQCHHIFQSMSTLMCELINVKELTDIQLEEMKEEVNAYLFDMNNISTKITTNYLLYMIEMLTFYESTCSECELFEAASNIQKFIMYYEG